LLFDHVPAPVGGPTLYPKQSAANVFSRYQLGWEPINAMVIPADAGFAK
jgi:hypothetical protein